MTERAHHLTLQLFAQALFAQSDAPQLWRQPLVWAALTFVAALWLLAPRGRFSRWQMAAGGVLGVVSLGLFASRVPVLACWGEQAMFWLLAALTLVGAGAMIAMRPVGSVTICVFNR